MKKVELDGNLEWFQYTAFGGEPYGPYYLRDGPVSVGSVSQCVGNKSHLWVTQVIPRSHTKEGRKLSCYASSKERAMYYVESWAKYHYKRTV